MVSRNLHFRLLETIYTLFFSIFGLITLDQLHIKLPEEGKKDGIIIFGCFQEQTDKDNIKQNIGIIRL